MRKTTKRRGGRFWPVPVFLIILLIFCPVSRQLTLSAEGQAVYSVPVTKGEQFQIRFTHSVNRSPVVDTIECTGRTLTIRSSLYQSFGAGMPASADEVGPNATFTDTPNGILIAGIDLEKDEIHKFTGTFADHFLLYRGREIQLKAFFGEQADLCLRIRYFTLPQLLFTRRL